jgi:hypothetical protein
MANTGNIGEATAPTVPCTSRWCRDCQRLGDGGVTKHMRATQWPNGLSTVWQLTRFASPDAADGPLHQRTVNARVPRRP